MRYWIAGTAFGLNHEDATCISSVYDDVVRRLAERGKHLWPALRDEAGIVLLRATFEATYCDTSESETWRAHHRVWDDLEMRMPGRGSELFDDSSRVLFIELGVDVRLIGGFVRHSATQRSLLETTPDQICEALSDIVLSADEVFGVFDEWMAALRAEFTNS